MQTVPRRVCSCPDASTCSMYLDTTRRVELLLAYCMSALGYTWNSISPVFLITCSCSAEKIQLLYWSGHSFRLFRFVAIQRMTDGVTVRVEYTEDFVIFVAITHYCRLFPCKCCDVTFLFWDPFSREWSESSITLNLSMGKRYSLKMLCKQDKLNSPAINQYKVEKSHADFVLKRETRS